MVRILWTTVELIARSQKVAKWANAIKKSGRNGLQRHRDAFLMASFGGNIFAKPHRWSHRKTEKYRSLHFLWAKASKRMRERRRHRESVVEKDQFLENHPSLEASFESDLYSITQAAVRHAGRAKVSSR